MILSWLYWASIASPYFARHQGSLLDLRGWLEMINRNKSVKVRVGMWQGYTKVPSGASGEGIGKRAGTEKH